MLNSINTNIAAYSAQGNIGKASNSAASSISRLSSGNRIVRAADDVAGLSIGTSLKTGVTTLRQALANTAQGSSLLQVADGALAQISDILQRQKAIATQANSGTLSDTERGYLDQEFQALASQIDQIVSSTAFSSTKLLDGSLAGSNPLTSEVNVTTATITGFTALSTNVTAVAFTDNASANATYGDTTFYGDLSEGTFQVIYTAAVTSADYTVNYTLNGSTYTGVVDVNAGTSFTLTNGDGTITFTKAADISGTYAASLAGADLFETALTTAFASAEAFSSRTLQNTNITVNGIEVEGSAIEAEDTNATLLDGMDGNDIRLQSEFWSHLNTPPMGNFTVVGTNGVGIKLQVEIGGKTYRTLALTDATDIANAGAAIYSGGANNTLRFFLDGDSTNNAQEYLNIDLTDSAQTIDLDNDEGVARFLEDLNDIFGRTGGGLELQVGTASSDVLSVAIGDTSTSKLYIDSAGAYQSLNVNTTADAKEASDVLDLAIAKVNSLRADVGALQSRVDFTAANLQSSIQNQDAARGTLLDTDVAAESTNYATAQVQLQAGIAVLAQANQIPQNLLKLIS